MKQINTNDLRTIDAGKTVTYYYCTKCKKNSWWNLNKGGYTALFWHIHASHKVSLGRVWSYIGTRTCNY